MIEQIFTLIRNANITLPVLEITILLIILSCCLVFKYTRVGLITAYLFTYRWGWSFLVCREQKHLIAYMIFGMAVGILTAIGMLRASPDD